ncbi:hypothetical protein ACKWRH_23600 [Bradyrhizobium sp. Pa8]|uniref:hypothetical protein n=1 Tax=Bradyrhizobium sp. Pa8 TaxID=3386552 RepID=UPI00403F55F5
MAPRTLYRQPQAGGQGFARTKKVFGGPTVNFVAADVALNAQTAVMRVPRGFILQSIGGTTGDLDTGATLQASLGDAANPARFVAAAAFAQAAGAFTPTLAAGAAGYEFPDDTDILVTVTAAAAGLGPTPTVSILMEGYMK